MSFLTQITPAPSIRPMFNLGCLMDIPTGTYELGQYGESILNAGLAHITGVGGRGNTFKSTISDFMILRVLDRYLAEALKYDTELSATLARLAKLSWFAEDKLLTYDMSSGERMVITDRAIMNGTEFFEKMKEATKYREKPTKDMMATTPFMTRDKKLISIIIPLLAFIDSLSQFSSANVLKIQDDGGIGDSSRNIEALRDAGAKAQMLKELPTLTAKVGMYMIMTAHMGDDLALDPYAPPQKKLGFLKNKIKFKGVPENFTFLTNNCWVAHNASVMANQSTKAPQFPRDGEDDLKGDTDLMSVMLQLVRGKFGMSGMTHEIVVSQSDGVHPGLTEFLYLQSHDRFGITGNDRSYALDFCPDVTLSRTTVRGKIDTDARVRRALNIQADILQMSHYWTHLPKGLLVPPKVLFEDLKAKGYDMDRLLATRPYWTFNNDKHPVPFLSTMDLLRMRTGEYKPYWWD